MSEKRPLAVYFERRNLIMLALGFSSGLPFLLVGNTLGYWLAEENTSLAAIGFISWVGLAYSFKYLWAPLIDHTSVFLFAKLGRRRSWMLLAQGLVLACLALMGQIGISHGLVTLGVLALIVAFSSATQDIVIDAWRIESARDAKELGVFTSAYTFGYRAALLSTEAIMLPIATRVGWNTSYVLYAGLMVLGITACLLAAEPARKAAPTQSGVRLFKADGVLDSIVGPFVAFFRAHGTMAILMLLAISLFQLPNFITGPMIGPLYTKIGLTKDMVGAVRGTFGLAAVFAGVAAGGFACLKLGKIRALVVGGSALILGTMSYAVLPYAHDPVSFAIIMAVDNFGIAMAGVTLVTYMSSLTTVGYTATQYALLSSVYTLIGKFLKGFSGEIVESLTAAFGLMNGFAAFFIGAGLIGIPSILLFLWIAAQRRQPPEQPIVANQ
ncbi:PAT family beta-lactamase induction signal transducer AmpG [Rhizomicrobium palustre]|uniref:PAT family beta-lactamase induction signal transducer AmpG n=1 Tax=Rhizomicrobium palustre TaxID=189966 RepID=A0A846MX74_9PROT|nr:MFS transporter [Rhizomicrobium palustre]NIK88154.1 PAT family beta-lactamase induction signal transducer AmpG [Rhizomicrobium palustre]